MKRTFGRNAFFVPLTLALSVALAGCGGDDPAEPELPEPTVLKVVVRSEADSSFVQNSNVVLYRAQTREAVDRGMTNPEGAVYFEQGVGDFYVDISAQGFEQVPPENIAPVPFYVAAEQTTEHEIYLDALEDTSNTGYVLGNVEPVIDNFLILAQHDGTEQKYDTACGPDGVFVAYNLPYGTYSFEALKSGYQMNDTVRATISADAPIDTVAIAISEYLGSVLNGSVSFLASENSIVDVTLLDAQTRAVVPGLAVMIDPTNLNYSMSRIPDGDYLAWASLKNDGYVIDPDWIFKNPGGLNIVFAAARTTELNFSVTDAIPLLSPTNPADTTFPAVVDSTVPTFRWTAYPSTKEYIVEVRDLNGKVLWGGFESDGTINHAFIGPEILSVEYNFDDQAGVPALQPGKIYQWQLWADKGTQFDGTVEQLISSSEDLRGIFQIPEKPPVE